MGDITHLTDSVVHGIEAAVRRGARIEGRLCLWRHFDGFDNLFLFPLRNLNLYLSGSEKWSDQIQLQNTYQHQDTIFLKSASVPHWSS